MRRLTVRRYTVCMVVLAAVLLGASARPAQMEDLEIAFEGPRILTSFRLTHVFSDELRTRIESGLATSFIYRIQMKRKRRWWIWDKNLSTSLLEVTAMYSSLPQEYVINFRHNGELIETRVARDIDELRAAMTEIRDLPALQLEGLMQDRRRVKVRVRAELGTKSRLFLVPTTIKTEWLETERFRLSDIETETP